jgi:hypothetical protein
MAAARPRGETLAVEGYQSLMRGLRDADHASRLAVRATLRHAGEAVRSDARTRVAGRPHDGKTAAGYKIRVRQRGLVVEQSLRKTTGLHPEWGAWQMRHALLPALAGNEQDTSRLMEHALDVIAARFNSGGTL